MNTGKIVLTGATGHLGSHVLKNLLSSGISPGSIRISSSNPSQVPDELKAQGIEVVHGTYDDPTTLDTAFANAGVLLLVSHPSFIHEHRVRVHKSAIDAAVRADVKHVVYTSLAFDPQGEVAVMAAYIETEKYLKESGLRYTIVREGIYSAVWKLFFGSSDYVGCILCISYSRSPFAGFFFDSGPDVTDVYVPGDGPVAWVNWEDLGEGTAKLILDRVIAYLSLLCKSQCLNFVSGPVRQPDR
jgi:nucleoside-diphosphate-sugar epimerase